jgi:hypothetical protein
MFGCWPQMSDENPTECARFKSASTSFSTSTRSSSFIPFLALKLSDMMRSFASRGLTAPAFARGIAGAAPVLYFPPTQSKLPRDQQIAKNTEVALDLIKRFKGPIPAPYTRRHNLTIEAIEKEIEALLGGAAKFRPKNAGEDTPMDKLTLMERCLRHALWSYHKTEGSYNFAEMEKWLVYTPTDVSKMTQLKREAEVKQKYVAFKARRAQEGAPEVSLPTFNLAKEYKANIDREVLVEKRLRYDTLAINTTERDEAKIEALLKQYRKPQQDQRLDALVDLLEKFKPVLAREAIMQRLTIKHLEGQLGIWRYLDWNPEVRDRAEVEVDVGAGGQQWWSPYEEARIVNIRLRSVSEVKAVMEKTQAAKAASTATTSVASGKGKDNAAREKLLQEVLRLQSRIGKKDDDEKPAAADKKDAKGHH